MDGEIEAKKEKTTVMLLASLKRKAKKIAIDKNITFSDAMNEALEDYVKKQDEK